MKEVLGYKGKLLLIIGSLGIIHSLYSSIQHLSFLKATSKVEDEFPFDITVEALIGLFLCMLSLCYLSLPFKPIKLEHYAPQKRIEEVDNSPSFITFNHRGSALNWFNIDRFTFYEVPVIA